MKIARIEQYFPRPRMRLVKVTTDTGLVGWGETTLEGKPRSTMAAVDELADYLIGKDPLRIEHHWQHIYRSAFFRGGNVLMSALSGIDQALWDIAGKHYGAPVYALLGGPTRDRVRVYAHWGVRDRSDESLARAKYWLEELQRIGGYTAFKSGPVGKWRAHEPPARVDEFIAIANLMREWVGPEVELAFDFHGKMTPGLAVEVIHQLVGMRPMFVEEPVPQDNIDALKLVADRVPVPIATGERLLSRWEFRRVLEQQACAYIQPDGSHAGGISELRRIAAMAEVYYIHTMPHCAIGAVALSACLHVDAATPNFLIQESIGPQQLQGPVQLAWQLKDGYMELPTVPGLGVEVDEKEIAHMSAYTEELGGEHFYEQDGSVADW
ncbi:MAG: galactonate dehydratase [Chloroflexi bacterium]|nr:galactonate dehydratase [Chloroflexota bacterium]